MRFDAEGRKWKAIVDMDCLRERAASAVLEGKIVASGGVNFTEEQNRVLLR